MSITRKNKRSSGANANPSWHVLLVEDQVSLAKMTASMLKTRWQCHVTIANTYQQTKKLLQTKADAFFLTVTDLNLPDAPNGEIIDLLAEFKQPTIAITGHFDQTAHEDLRKKGVIDYVLKKNINAYEYLSNFVGRLYYNQQIKVLVIDDSEAMRKMAGHYLEQQFLKIIYAQNGEEGLSQLNKHPDIKLVLVDAEMPKMNGLTFTAKARQIKANNDLTIIGISSADTADLSTQFLKHGANDFISKPFSYEELTCRVNQNLNLLDYITKINKIAHIDYLTELPNRRYFFEKGQSMFTQAFESNAACIVGILDIDHFKRINDEYGHDCGDVVLQAVSSLFKTHLKGQHIARIGGEEFGFILQSESLQNCAAMVDVLHQKIAQQTIDYEGEQLTVTASIGYTSRLQKNLDDTLIEADSHLYTAKANGRNQIVTQQAALTTAE